MSHAPSCLTVLYLLVGASIQDGEKYWELLRGDGGTGRRKREVGPGCVRNSLYINTDDDGAGCPVLLPHLEGSGQACCLPFMGGDHRLWEVKGALWVLEGRDTCLELVLAHVLL